MTFFQSFARQFQVFPKNYLNFLSHFNHLSLLINPARPVLNQTECFLTFFCTKCILDCFSWHFGPSETICPETFFEQRAKSTIWTCLTPTKLLHSCPTLVKRRTGCLLEQLCYSGNVYTLINVGKRRKNTKYETTLDHARRP